MENRLMKIVTWGMGGLLLTSIWLFPSLAMAEDGTSSAAGDMIMMVLKLVFSVLGILGTWLTTKAIGYFEKKTKIDVPASLEATIQTWAGKAVTYAYEKSHQKVQSLGDKLKGPEKLEVALEFLNKLIKDNNLPAQAEEKLRQYIESAIGGMRKDNNTSVEDTEK